MISQKINIYRKMRLRRIGAEVDYKRDYKKINVYKHKVEKERISRKLLIMDRYSY